MCPNGLWCRTAQPSLSRRVSARPVSSDRLAEAARQRRPLFIGQRTRALIGSKRRRRGCACLPAFYDPRPAFFPFPGRLQARRGNRLVRSARSGMRRPIDCIVRFVGLIYALRGFLKTPVSPRATGTAGPKPMMSAQNLDQVRPRVVAT